MNGLPTIAIPQPALPSPLPTDWQLLTNAFYDHWQALCAQVRKNNADLKPGCDDIWIDPSTPGMLRTPNQDEIAAVMPAKVNAAVVLANFNGQVLNGGFDQWHGNGYSVSAPTLLQLLDGAAAIGIEDAADVAEMVRTFVQRTEDAEEGGRGYDNDDEEEDGGRVDDDLCDRYYAKDRDPMFQAILDRFEDCVLQQFGAAAFLKKAA